MAADPQDILTRANAAFTAGRYDDAAADFRAVINAHPDIGELYINLGAALRAAGDIRGAESALRDAVRLLPDSAAAWFNLGNLLSADNRGTDALAAYEKADGLQPATPEILNNLGVQLYELGQIERALEKYDAALAVKPEFADALTNRGNALQRLCRMAEAERAIDAALAINPAHPVYLLNRASFLAASGKHADALAWTDRSIAADPGYTKAQLKKAALLIQSGDLDAGFRAYETRWSIPGWHALPARLPMPAWQGGDIAGKSLLVWNEQGFGDALMYARYLPALAAMGADVRVMCEKPLIRLFAQSFDDRVTVHPLDGDIPAADLHCSIMSLPFLLRTTLATIPADVPYLTPDPTDAARWSDEVAALADGRPAVGLIWAGNPGQAHDYSRSIAPDTIAPLLDRDDIRFFNLLVGPRGDEIQDPRLIDVRRRLKDFADTAALMQHLDLIISVDSAPAHLAGALGRPMWVLLSYDPDSRYFLGRSDCPWYPAGELIRQNAPGDWARLIKCVDDALDTFVRVKAKR